MEAPKETMGMDEAKNDCVCICVLRGFFLILQTIIQQKQTRLIINKKVPLSLASGFSFPWFSMPLTERKCSLGISIHGFKVTLQDNAGHSHNSLIMCKNKKKSQALKMLKTTSIGMHEKRVCRTIVYFAFTVLFALVSV